MTHQGRFEIPGEPVLALWSKKFYPARIQSFDNDSKKYKVQFFDGAERHIKRSSFFSRYDDGFKSAPVRKSSGLFNPLSHD
jgi:hypothetical protein